MSDPKIFVLPSGDGVCFNPDQKFHGWLMRKHPDGQWISVQKLDAVDPFDAVFANLFQPKATP